MNPLTEKILYLLANNPSEFSDTCQAIFASGSPIVKSFDLPLKQARDVYYARSEFNELRGSKIRGFKELVLGLKNETETMVGVQSITVGPRHFILLLRPTFPG